MQSHDDELHRVPSYLEEGRIAEVGHKFHQYLLDRGYHGNTAYDYCRTLTHEKIRPYMLKHYGCTTIYWLKDTVVLRDLIKNISGLSESMVARVRNATSRYIEYLRDCEAVPENKNRDFVDKAKDDFLSYLISLGLNDRTCNTYAQTLCSPLLTSTLLSKYNVGTVYEIANEEILKTIPFHFEGTKIDRNNQLRAAINKYISFLHDKKGAYVRATANLLMEGKQESATEKAEKDISLQIGQYEEMCDIAMHANILDAYNFFVMESLRESGRRYMVLNEAHDYNYWYAYSKEAIGFLLGPENQGLADQFMDFFNAEDRFKSAKLVNVLMEEEDGERCWKYWQTIARWKMAEKLMSDYYEWDDQYHEWCSKGSFGQKEAMELSNIERNFSVYSKDEIKRCADRAKAIISENGWNINGASQIPSEAIRRTELSASLKEKMCQQALNYKAKKESSGVLADMAMDNLFANSDFNAMKDTIRQLEQRLADTESQRDEAIDAVEELEGKLAESEGKLAKVNTENKQKRHDHNEVVGAVFSEIARRVLDSTKKKRTEQRTKVKESLQSIMNELKMHPYVPEDLQKCINSFDDETPPPVPNYYINGDLVLQKHVDQQVGTIAKGGIGTKKDK